MNNITESLIEAVKQSQSARNIKPLKETFDLNRRLFLQVGGLSAVSILTGCMINPVTGKSELSFMGQQDEIGIDKEYSPKQFSNDYGVLQDQSINAYINNIGLTLARKTHRPDMPYSFRATNAYYMNAYTFPGGTVAITRYLLAKLENEEQLAAILGHELGHVNARHTAAIMTRSTLLQGALALGSLAAGKQFGETNPLLAQSLNLAGALGGQLYLASYSRDNEREADDLGQLYMARSNYNPIGMADAMNVLNKEHQSNPNAVEILFATHPMTRERYETTKTRANTQYKDLANQPTNKERYLDVTAPLRAQLPIMKSLSEGDKAMEKKNLAEAENHYLNAVAQGSADYAANCRMGEFYVATKRTQQALPYLQRARQLYPGEARAAKVLGTGYAQNGMWDQALNQFNDADRLLPGNPEMTFLKGLCHEGMGDRDMAARHYASYLKVSKEGKEAEYAYSRLVSWGFIRPVGR
jgi:predicted Zn-dependent protease